MNPSGDRENDRCLTDYQIATEVYAEMANEVGKRYMCKECGAEFIVTRGGDGTLYCCGQPMELKKPGGEKK